MGISFSLSSFWELLVSRWPELVTELFRHINMTTLALLISLAIGVPLGILITRNQTAAKIVIGIANVMQPSPPSPCCPWPSAFWASARCPPS